MVLDSLGMGSFSFGGAIGIFFWALIVIIIVGAISGIAYYIWWKNQFQIKVEIINQTSGNHIVTNDWARYSSSDEGTSMIELLHTKFPNGNPVKILEPNHRFMHTKVESSTFGGEKQTKFLRLMKCTEDILIPWSPEIDNQCRNFRLPENIDARDDLDEDRKAEIKAYVEDRKEEIRKSLQGEDYMTSQDKQALANEFKKAEDYGSPSVLEWMGEHSGILVLFVAIFGVTMFGYMFQDIANNAIGSLEEVSSQAEHVSENNEAALRYMANIMQDRQVAQIEGEGGLPDDFFENISNSTSSSGGDVPN